MHSRRTRSYWGEGFPRRRDYYRSDYHHHRQDQTTNFMSQLIMIVALVALVSHFSK